MDRPLKHIPDEDELLPSGLLLTILIIIIVIAILVIATASYLIAVIIDLFFSFFFNLVCLGIIIFVVLCSLIYSLISEVFRYKTK